MATMVLRSMSTTNSFFRLQLGIRISPFSASFQSESCPKHLIVTNLNDALKVFDKMSQTQPLPSHVKFTHLLQSVTKMKHFSSSIHLFNRMCALGVPVNEYTMNIVINCCCHLYRSKDAFAVLGSCFKRNIVPNVTSFSTLLNGLILEGKIREAERLFAKVITDKLCEPDVVMYSTMIKGLCKTHDYVQSVGLLHLMDASGCKPNVVTYNTVIDSMCKRKMIDDAFNIYKEMVFQKGIPPNAVTYNSLIPGLCKVGRSEEASKMLNEVSVKGLQPDVYTYNAMIMCFGKEGLPKDANELFLKMKENGCSPDETTFNVLLHGCLKNQQYDDVKMLLVEMDERGYLLRDSTLSLLQSRIAAKILDESLLELIGKLEPENSVNASCLDT